ncbi:MAG: FAD-dependent oxidoreductase [Cyanobacteria bacterium P01_F01_bin.150]
MTKIVIVGAGPTGASLALLLAERGIHVTLIEATKEFRRVFRGEGLMPSGLEALAQMGLTEVIKKLPVSPLTAWEFIINGKPLFRVEEPMGSDRPCTLVSQPPLLDALVKRAKAYPTFEFIQGVAVKDVLWRPLPDDQNSDKKRVSGVRLVDGRTITASLVIGADGRNSMIRQRAGLELVTQPKSIDVLWFKLPAPPRLVENNVFCSIVKQGQVFSVFHSAEPGQMHVAWVVYPKAANRAASPKKNDKQTNEKLSSRQWAERFASLSPDWLAQHFLDHGDAIASPIRLSVLVGRCPAWHKPGVLLLGDAAHPMSPVRAQGINMAFRDVIVTANHLVPILNAEARSSKSSQDSSLDIHEQSKLDLLLDGAIATIQSEREPEIIRAQQLQTSEASQGELLRSNTLVLTTILNFAPILSPLLKKSWVHKQHQLRQGITKVTLLV